MHLIIEFHYNLQIRRVADLVHEKAHAILQLLQRFLVGVEVQVGTAAHDVVDGFKGGCAMACQLLQRGLCSTVGKVYDQCHHDHSPY